MSYALGIDIGTSKVAVAVVDNDSGKTVEAVSILHAAETSTEPLWSEQDPQKLFDSIDIAMKGLPPDVRKAIGSIGVCGQMHGIVLWKDDHRENSQLITWQDKRAADGAFMSVLRKTSGLRNIHPGYGVVTLAWLATYQDDILSQFSHSGTIMDFVVSCMCDLDEPAMDPTNASSWGFFDSENYDWHRDALEAIDIPVKLLPRLVNTGSKAGTLSDEFATRWHLPAGIPVCVACGDSPAAVYAAKDVMETGCYLNLGTGGQLSIVVDRGAAEDVVDVPGIDVRPFPGKKELVVASSPFGGKAFLWLVETIEHWLEELGCDPIPRDTIFNKLNELGKSKHENEPPSFLPYTSPEEDTQGLLGTISGITTSNLSIAMLARSVAEGMVKPLFDRMPKHLLANKTSVVGTGNGIRRSELLRDVIEDVSGLELTLADIIEEAASGVARMAADSLLKPT